MANPYFDPFEPGEGSGGGGDFSFQSQNGDAPFVMPQMPIDPLGRSSQNYGLIGLIMTFLCCSIVGLILGIIALTRASASRRMLGFESAPASVGRVLGILAIVFSAVRMIVSVAWLILISYGVFSGLAALGAGGGTVI